MQRSFKVFMLQYFRFTHKYLKMYSVHKNFQCKVGSWGCNFSIRFSSLLTLLFVGFIYFYLHFMHLAELMMPTL